MSISLYLLSIVGNLHAIFITCFIISIIGIFIIGACDILKKMFAERDIDDDYLTHMCKVYFYFGIFIISTGILSAIFPTQNDIICND